MSCNSCAKSFSILRPEKGCPGCGFSYCSKCLSNKLFLQKVNSEVKVCSKCKRAADSKKPNQILPPDAYFKRVGIPGSSAATSSKDESENNSEKEIYERLQKLKEDKVDVAITSNLSDSDIANRLKKLKGDIPSTSDAELNARLGKLKGISLSSVDSKPVLPAPDTRTEQEQADDLMRQYMQQANIDNQYEEEFAGLVKDIESRLQNLKKSSGNGTEQNEASTSDTMLKDEDDILKIIEKAKAEAVLEENEICDSSIDELPFCEICNEDATLRCLGCKYLFCKRCFLEHKDEDDGCDKYVPYIHPQKN